MSFLGDLERFAASTLYPWRFAILVLTVAAAVGLVVLAARRGWLAAARRHPGRTGALVVAILVVLTPAAWYLGSPLFTRTELQEPPPVAVVASPVAVVASPVAVVASPVAVVASPVAVVASPVAVVASPVAVVASPVAGSPAASTTGPTSTSPVASEPASVPPPTPTPTPAPAPLVRSGTFVGADDFHFGRGRATLTEAPDGSHTLRFDGFSVRNGPDLFVYLSPDPDGYATGAIELGRLRATDGSFNTPIPAGTDIGTARSVVIWCREFAVLFAVAGLDG